MARLDWSQRPPVESVPGRVSGAWVFTAKTPSLHRCILPEVHILVGRRDPRVAYAHVASSRVSRLLHLFCGLLGRVTTSIIPAMRSQLSVPLICAFLLPLATLLQPARFGAYALSQVIHADHVTVRLGSEEGLQGLYQDLTNLGLTITLRPQRLSNGSSSAVVHLGVFGFELIGVKSIRMRNHITRRCFLQDPT